MVAPRTPDFCLELLTSATKLGYSDITNAEIDHANTAPVARSAAGEPATAEERRFILWVILACPVAAELTTCFPHRMLHRDGNPNHHMASVQARAELDRPAVTDLAEKRQAMLLICFGVLPRKRVLFHFSTTQRILLRQL
jgi:hypothetical protein